MSSLLAFNNHFLHPQLVHYLTFPKYSSYKVLKTTLDISHLKVKVTIILRYGCSPELWSIMYYNTTNAVFYLT